MRFVVALCLVAGSLAPTSVQAWPGAVHEQTVLLATKLMPTALRQQLDKHRDALLAGARGDGCAGVEHSIGLDGSGGQLDVDAAAVAERVVLTIREHGDFATVARLLGELSHLAGDAAFPLNTSTSDAREPRYYVDYERYVTTKVARFPPVFNGYLEFGEGFTVASYVRSIADRANRRYPLVGQAYFPQGDAIRPSTSFDDRDPVFAVSQLSFVDALTATANVWLYTWQRAHGDLSGTPHMANAEAPAVAKDPTRAAQRP